MQKHLSVAVIPELSKNTSDLYHHFRRCHFPRSGKSAPLLVSLRKLPAAGGAGVVIARCCCGDLGIFRTAAQASSLSFSVASHFKKMGSYNRLTWRTVLRAEIMYWTLCEPVLHCEEQHHVQLPSTSQRSVGRAFFFVISLVFFQSTSASNHGYLIWILCH